MFLQRCIADLRYAVNAGLIVSSIGCLSSNFWAYFWRPWFCFSNSSISSLQSALFSSIVYPTRLIHTSASLSIRPYLCNFQASYDQFACAFERREDICGFWQVPYKVQAKDEAIAHFLTSAFATVVGCRGYGNRRCIGWYGRHLVDGFLLSFVFEALPHRQCLVSWIDKVKLGSRCASTDRPKIHWILCTPQIS